MSYCDYLLSTPHTPVWYNAKKVRELYRRAKMSGRHVDHIVPINSHLVCGLHCHDNLKILPPLTNIAKSNCIWPNMPDEPTELFEIQEAEQYEFCF